jgi:hypothetical protein
MVRTTFTALAAAVALLGTAPAAGAAECQLTQYASADIVFHPQAGVLVPVRIGEQDAWVALYMSSGLAMISPAAVRQLGLKTGYVDPTLNIRANGQPVEREVKLESLVIGGANFAGWSFYVQPGPERPLNQYQGRPMIGTLSARFMNVVDMELDLAGRKMNLFKHSRCRGGQVYWSREYTKEYLYVDPSGLLYFPMEIDDRRIETSLNTAGPRSRLSETIARRYFGFRRDASAPRNNAPRGSFPIVGARNVALTARQLSLADQPVHVYDDLERRCDYGQSERGSNAIGFRNCFGIVPFEIGTELLQQLRIYIASEEKQIYITRNAPTAPAGAADAGAGDAGVVPGAPAGAPAAVPAAVPDDPPGVPAAAEPAPAR